MMNLAPIVIFAFNRLDMLRHLVESLKVNTGAAESDLFVFVDGPRPDKPGEEDKVCAVREYVKRIEGFKSLHCEFSEANKGLARSVIEGTTKIISKCGKVIVVEDDLFMSKSFLLFMNKMLSLYECDQRVMQVSGFGTKLNNLGGYPYDAYLNERAHSWSWGTWKDRWASVDWEVSDFNQLKVDKKKQHEFCKRGSDLYGMLRKYMEGKNNSWYIRFEYSMFKQHRYTVCPIRSLVRNDGFIAEATHCNVYNRYKIDFEENHDGDFNVPERLQPVENLMREAVKYWSVRYRIYGKFRTLLMKFL